MIALGMVTLLLRSTFKNHLGSLLQHARSISSPSGSQKGSGHGFTLHHRWVQGLRSEGSKGPKATQKASRLFPAVAATSPRPSGHKVQSWGPCRSSEHPETVPCPHTGPHEKFLQSFRDTKLSRIISFKSESKPRVHLSIH